MHLNKSLNRFIFFYLKATYVLKIIKGTMSKAAVHHCLKDVMKCRLCNVRNEFTFNFKDVWL